MRASCRIEAYTFGGAKREVLNKGEELMTEIAASVKDNRRKLRYRWWFANVVGLIIAFLLFSLIGHGITGPHGDDLTFAQDIAHTLGLLVVGLILFSAQRAALGPWLSVSAARIIGATIVFTAAFQFGAKIYRPPTDWILGFTVLGSAAWVSFQGFKGRRLVWTIATILGFCIGMAFTTPVMFAAIRSGVFDPESPTLLDHTITWVLGAGMTGIFGGYISSWPLSRLLISSYSSPSSA
ncbi:hypothetical protein L0156_22490 [bacterium]|nr:hypothetical protein [bacterium]